MPSARVEYELDTLYDVWAYKSEFTLRCLLCGWTMDGWTSNTEWGANFHGKRHYRAKGPGHVVEVTEVTRHLVKYVDYEKLDGSGKIREEAARDAKGRRVWQESDAGVVKAAEGGTIT